jgi:hypothetical protein
MDNRYCNFCNKEHPLTDEFWYFGNKSKIQCKIHVKDKCAQRREKCAEHIRIQKHEAYLRDKSKVQERHKQYYKEHKKHLLQKAKEYRQLNQEDIRKTKKLCYEKNKEQYTKRSLEYVKYKCTTDPAFRIIRRIRKRVWDALRRCAKPGSSIVELGCTPIELVSYLESKFQEGMTWENYGVKGWHIDHIIPLSSFDLSDYEQFKAACHYTNLQPLWAIDNIRKSNKKEEGLRPPR